MSATVETNASENTTVQFPGFDANKASDQFRVYAEKGMEQTREAYARMKTGAEWAQKSLETAVDASRTATSELSLKTIAAMRSHANASFDQLEALAGAKTISEVLELQGRFFRERFEQMVAQSRDMQSAAGKAAEDIARPVKDGFEAALKELKVA